MNKKFINGVSVALILFGVIILAVSLWEGFGGAARKMRIVEVPGFAELQLDQPGIYAGVYQHRGNGPMPIAALSHLDVRLMSKGTYEEVPVLLNSAGQTFSRFGLKGMPLFNFMIDRPGSYTMSAFYPSNQPGPTVNVMIFSQAAQSVKQTLAVGVLFFLVFVGLGSFVLVRFREPKGGRIHG